MTWRLIRAWTPSEDPQLLMLLAGDAGVLFHHSTELAAGGHLLEVLATRSSVEGIVSLLAKTYGELEGFRVVVQEVAGVVPRPPDAEELELDDDIENGPPMSVEELLESAFEQAEHGAAYIAAVAVASLVGATGVLRDSTELIVGSMIIAPLLGPSMALSLSITLGELRLFRRSIFAHVVGVGVALIVSILFGLTFGIPAEGDHVLSRINIGLLDFVVAASAGVVGALATVERSISSVVGVMIAVALLPPLVVTGMLIGNGNFYLAIGPALLTITNLVGINLVSGVVFRILGVKPREIAQQNEARRAFWISTTVWVLMLVGLVVMLYFAPRFRTFP